MAKKHKIDEIRMYLRAKGIVFENDKINSIIDAIAPLNFKNDGIVTRNNLNLFSFQTGLYSVTSIWPGHRNRRFVTLRKSYVENKNIFLVFSDGWFRTVPIGARYKRLSAGYEFIIGPMSMRIEKK